MSLTQLVQIISEAPLAVAEPAAGIVLGSLTASGQRISAALSGYNGASIYLSGTYTAIDSAFEVSYNNGLTYVSAPAAPLSGGAPVIATGPLSSISGSYLVHAPGATHVAVTATAHTAGTLSVRFAPIVHATPPPAAASAGATVVAPTPVTGSLTAAAQRVSAPLATATGASVYLSGTYTAADLAFEASFDNATTFISINAVPVSGTNVVTTTGPLTNASAAYDLYAPGATHVSVRAAALTAGVVAVRLTPILAAQDPNPVAGFFEPATGITTGSLTAAAQRIAAPLTGRNGASVYLSGTYAATDVTFEVSFDNAATYVAINAVPISGTAVATTSGPQTNAAQAYDIYAPGATHLGVRATAIASGALAVRIAPIVLAQDPNPIAALVEPATGIITGNLTTVAQRVTAPLTGRNGASIYLSGTYAAADVTFEASFDNAVTFLAINAVSISGSTVVTATGAQSNALQAFDVYAPGATHLSVRLTAITSGVVAVRLAPVVLAQDPNPVGSLAEPASGIITGSITAAAQRIAAPLTGRNGASIYLAGTYAAADLTFEASFDNAVTYVMINAVPVSGANVVIATGPQTNAAQAYDLYAPGATHLSVRATAITSGSVAVRIAPVVLAQDPNPVAGILEPATGVTSGNLTTVAQRVVAPLTGRNGASIYLAGTYVAADVTFEASFDNAATYVPINGVPISGTNVLTATGPQTNASQAYDVYTPGATHIGARLTAITSGAVAVRIAPVVLAQDPNPVPGLLEPVTGIVNGAITANAQRIACDLKGFNGATVFLTGTYSTVNLTFEASYNAGVTYILVNAVAVSAASVVTATGNQTNASLAYEIYCPGATQVSVRSTAFTSGSQTVRISPTVFAQDPNPIIAGTATVSGSVTVSGTATVSGPAADSAAASGNPVQTAGKVRTAVDTTYVAADAMALTGTTGMQLLVKPFGLPETDWQFTGALTTATATAARAAGAVGIRNHVTGLQYQNTSATASELQLLDGVTAIWRGQAPANMALPAVVTFNTPLRGTAATALNTQTLTTGTNTLVNIQGYQSA